MNIKIKKIRRDDKIPIRASDGAIGYDVFASVVLDKHTKKVISTLPVEIFPGGSLLIGIGVKMAIPWQYEAQVRPRSGLASKYDIELSNSPGTIDPDFRGEAGVLLRNRGDKPFTIEKDMRVAQLIFSKVEIPVLEEADELPSTRRDIGGFGHTGLFGTGLGTDQFQKAVQERDQYYMGIVLATAERSRCVRGVKRVNGEYERDEKGNLVGQTRKLGCVIVGKEDNIIAHGFNAQYPGSSQCVEVGCLREEMSIPSGEQIEKCRAMHAEWWAFTNALRSGSGSVKGADIFLNAEPCEICAKIITGLGIETMILLAGVYPTNGTEIIRNAGINVRYIEI
ncbi:MAG: dUTP diphosphatase [Pseudomonadota bacterium]